MLSVICENKITMLGKPEQLRSVQSIIDEHQAASPIQPDYGLSISIISSLTGDRFDGAVDSGGFRIGVAESLMGVLCYAFHSEGSPPLRGLSAISATFPGMLVAVDFLESQGGLLGAAAFRFGQSIFEAYLPQEVWPEVVEGDHTAGSWNVAIQRLDALKDQRADCLLQGLAGGFSNGVIRPWVASPLR